MANGGYNGGYQAEAIQDFGMPLVGIAPQATGTQKRQTVQDALEEHEKAISELHGLIHELKDRLSSVLEAQPANSLQPPSAPTPIASNVLDRLMESRRSIAAAAAHVQRLIQRVQL
jgi:hypothetical protein